MNTRKIYILQTRFFDNGTKIMSCLTRSYYVHCSIGFEEDMNTFYSFVTKGFRVEQITRYVKPDREAFPCQMYEMEVKEDVYDRLKLIVNRFVESKDELKYSSIGVILSILHIPFKQNNHYFCSHFVAHVLGKGDAIRLKKRSQLYMPTDISNIPGLQLIYKGNLRAMMEEFQIMPCAA